MIYLMNWIFKELDLKNYVLYSNGNEIFLFGFFCIMVLRSGKNEKLYFALEKEQSNDNDFFFLFCFM